MARNLVICCDGTSNQFGADNTSIVGLYSALERDPAIQKSFYDPGVGTFAAQPRLTRVGSSAMRILDLAFGHSLTQNVLDAYRFLMRCHQPQDRVFLYGFSRGAYTVRVLAGMLHRVGLLCADNVNLVRYANGMYKNERRERVCEAFKATFSRECRIHFLGLFDTVSSVGWVWDPQTRPYTANNPSVGIVRHAIAIDERRAFYRQNLWGDPEGDQDVKQVWFAGYHGDVGGFAPLHEAALEWMLVESSDAGLELDDTKAARLVAGLDYRQATRDTLTWKWAAGEWFPKLRFDPRTGGRRPALNLGAPRSMPEGALVHETAILRKNEMDYAPENLPEGHRVEPWRRFED